MRSLGLPDVSVLLPAYNAESTIVAAVLSILDGTFSNLELVVVDDGSSDRTAELLAGMAEADSRIRLLLGPHKGLVASLNRCIEAARAPLLARMDADDWSHPTRLQRQVEFLNERPDLAVIDCQAELGRCDFTGDGMVAYVSWINSLVTSGQIHCNLLVESPLVHPAVLMRRAAVESVGAYLEDGTPEDYGLWLRLASAGYGLGKLPEHLFRWNDSPSRVTRTDPRCELESAMRLRVRHIPDLVAGAGEGVVVWGMGPTGRLLLKHLGEQGIPVKRLIDIDAKKVGNVWQGIRIEPLEALLKGPQESPILVALGTRPAKELVREHARRQGWEEGVDFWLVS